MHDPRPVARALARHTSRLLSLTGVVGAAEGEQDGEPCIVILIERWTPLLRAELPRELDGIPVQVCESGTIYPTGRGPA